LTDGQPQAGPNANADLLYTFERSDGSKQVVYNGWPLYLYVNDSQPGDVNGQAIAPPTGDAFGATWYLVAPDGSMITQTVSEPTAPADGDEGDGGDDGGGGGGGGGYY
jgi:hypothetical protein